MSEAPETNSRDELAPSGHQFSIASGDAQAVVTEVGAGLRELSLAGEPIVWGYRVAEMAGGGRGQILAPWPNRLEDGTYSFAGVSANAALNEPERGNAIHGLVRWLVWQLQTHSAERVELSCELAPQPAYPWWLHLELAYEISADGLVVEAAAENRSKVEAPFGLGAHPYLYAGRAGVDGVSLHLVAGRRLVLDERGLPRGSVSVAGTAVDFSSPKPLAGVVLDDCFTDLSLLPHPLPGAAWQATLLRGNGRTASVWADEGFPYVMCFTGDTLPGEDRRKGVAIEPMTCPPNALRTGDSLVSLAGGERWSGRFGITWTS